MPRASSSLPCFLELTPFLKSGSKSFASDTFDPGSTRNGLTKSAIRSSRSDGICCSSRSSEAEPSGGRTLQPSSCRPHARTLPGGPRLPHVLGDGLVERPVEVLGVDRARELVALDLLAYGVLHLSEHQRRTTVVEPDIQLLQHVGGRGVDVGDRLRCDDDPAEIWVLLRDRPQGITEHPRIGEDQRRVEAIDNQTRK